MGGGAGARALLRQFVRAGRGFGDYNLRECGPPPPPPPLGISPLPAAFVTFVVPAVALPCDPTGLRREGAGTWGELGGGACRRRG